MKETPKGLVHSAIGDGPLDRDGAAVAVHEPPLEFVQVELRSIAWRVPSRADWLIVSYE